MYMDMESAFALMEGNDNAIEALARRENLRYYNNKMPDEVRLLVESLGGKVEQNEDRWNIIFNE